MSKNGIPMEKFLQILRDRPGLEVVRQRMFIRVTSPNGWRAYVRNTDPVTRVDLQCPTPDHPAVRMLEEHERFCRIVAQLDFSLPAEAVLFGFRSCLDHMLGESQSPRTHFEDQRISADR